MRWSKRGTVALAAGAAWPFAFAPFGLWPLAVVSLCAFFAALDGIAPRRAAWHGFLFGLGAFGAGVWWVFVSMHGFGGLHWTLSAILTALLVTALALFVAGFGWLAARLAPAAGAWRWLTVLPAAWVLVEWLRSWLLSGFPWLLAGTAFIDAPLGGWSPVGGVLSVSLAAALTAGAILTVLYSRRSASVKRDGEESRLAEPLLRGGVAVTIVAICWIGGLLLDRVSFHQPSGPPLSVALLQGNVSQDLKWSPDQLLPTIRLYDGLNAAHQDADLIVWPEAALPALHHHLVAYLEPLAETAREHGTAVMMGVLVHEPDTGHYFNGILALGDGEGLYFKRHLVPFGEFFPVPGFVREWLRMMNLPYSDFTRGPRRQPPMVARGHAVAGSICYEAAYGATLARDAAAAELLVNVSNDAWFGDTIAPHQHLQIARQRAREAGRWLLRATNTGITAAIAPDGRVHARLPQFEEGVLRVEVEPLTGATPYTRFRDFPVLFLALLMLGAGLRFRYP